MTTPSATPALLAGTTETWDLVRRCAADPACGFSLGVFGAIAEFMRAPGEPAAFADGADGLHVATDRGAMRIARHAGARALVYQTPSRLPERRHQDIAVCLPEEAARRASRAVLAELGPDGEAIRPQDRAAILFDLGLGTSSLDAMIRTADAKLIAALRAVLGRPLFASGILAAIGAASPHRVFASALGRIEVFAPIPPPDGQSPDGPHTHLLPKLLEHRRTHAATVPVPAGLVPCLGIHPTAGAAPDDAGGH